MSISKGLILYKASRHHESSPVNIKRGYYSDKIVLMSTRKTKKQAFCRKYHQKLIKELKLTFVCDTTTKFEVLRHFTKFCRIKKCSVEPYLQASGDDGIEYLGIRLFKSLCKVLKRIKHLKVQDPEFNFIEVHKKSKTEKAFMLLTCLESFTFHYLGYSENTMFLEQVLNIIKLASRINCWPNFKSFNINFLEPGRYNWSRKNVLPLESLQNLLRFVQGLKNCRGSFSKCLGVGQFTLPYFSDFNAEQAEILREISNMIPIIKGVDIGEFEYFTEILEIFQHSTRLQRVSLEIKDAPQIQDKTTDLSIFNRMKALQEFELRAETKVREDLTLYRYILAQIKTIAPTLTAFSFHIGGGAILTEEIKLDLVSVISSLTELKSLKLRFWNRYGNTADFLAFKSLWLGDIFEAISKRTKLEKLSISFCAFSNDLFVAFRKFLKELKQLSDLHLGKIDCEKSGIEEKEIVKFWKSLRKLINLQKIDVDEIPKPSQKLDG